MFKTANKKRHSILQDKMSFKNIALTLAKVGNLFD